MFNNDNQGITQDGTTTINVPYSKEYIAQMELSDRPRMLAANTKVVKEDRTG